MANGLTPPVINRVPRGLLDYFGLKNGGENPHAILADISPGFDVLDWFTEPDLEVYYGTGSHNAVGNTTGLSASGRAFGGSAVVARDWMFVCRRAAVYIQGGGATVTSYRASIGGLRMPLNVTGLTPTRYATGTTEAWTSGDYYSVVFVPDRPVWLRPGESIYAQTERIAGGGSVTVQLMVEGWSISTSYGA